MFVTLVTSQFVVFYQTCKHLLPVFRFNNSKTKFVLDNFTCLTSLSKQNMSVRSLKQLQIICWIFSLIIHSLLLHFFCKKNTLTPFGSRKNRGQAENNPITKGITTLFINTQDVSTTCTRETLRRPLIGIFTKHKK